MKNIKFFATLSFVALVISGCAPKYNITYDSIPRGATLICNGHNMGYTPTVIEYKADEKNKTIEDFFAVNCSANWISGFTSEYSVQNWNLEKNEALQTLQREKDKDGGYEKDVNFALEVEKLMYQKQTAEATKSLKEQAQRDSLYKFQRYYYLRQPRIIYINKK